MNEASAHHGERRDPDDGGAVADGSSPRRGVRVAYELTVDDLVNASMHHFDHDPAFRRTVRDRRVIATVLTALAAVVASRLDAAGWGEAAFVGIAASVAVFLSMPRLSRWSMRRGVTRLLARSGTVTTGPASVWARHDGLHEALPGREVTIGWSSVRAIRQDAQGIHVDAGQEVVHIPARVAPEAVGQLLVRVHEATGLETQPG